MSKFATNPGPTPGARPTARPGDLSPEQATGSLEYRALGAKGERPAAARFESRVPVVLLLVAALLLTGVAQQFAQSRRDELVRPTGSSARLSNLNSYSLALLLGGLRGPLVMALWSSSENQKQEKDLEDFDTKIELIRLLQPEFVSVHMFQIWNKAYNISVLMASLSNKYAAILDGLEYARKVDAERPDDINIQASTADLYFNKLGGSAEKEYYTRRVMEESRWRGGGPSDAAAADPAWRRTRLDPMLDPAGNLLPALVTPKVKCPPGVECNDGSELQYLKAFEPFPYGVSPLALGFNYYKRAEVLKNTAHQRHLQLSDMVTDSRPPVSLKTWSEGEYELATKGEIAAFGAALPENWMSSKGALAAATAGVAPSTLVSDPAALREIIYHYRMVARVAAAADAEYERHMRSYANNGFLYRGHRDELRARSALALGDADYLEAMTATGEARAQKFAAAKAHYQQAEREWNLMLLKYGPNDLTAASFYPPGVNKQNIDDPKVRSAAQLAQLADVYRRRFPQGSPGRNSDESVEYDLQLQRAVRRLGLIGD